MKRQQSNNRQAHVSRKVTVKRQLPLVEQDIVVCRRQGLPIRSNLSAGDPQSNKEDCEADGGEWFCNSAAQVCGCTYGSGSDSGTGDWD